MAVNAHGDVDLDGTADGRTRSLDPLPPPFGNTTIGVIATNARLDKLGCLLVARRGPRRSGPLAWCPAHTRVDGDALVAVATGRVEARVDAAAAAAVTAVERASRW